MTLNPAIERFVAQRISIMSFFFKGEWKVRRALGVAFISVLSVFLAMSRNGAAFPLNLEIKRFTSILRFHPLFYTLSFGIFRRHLQIQFLELREKWLFSMMECRMDSAVFSDTL